jgi:hypothetical protein
MMKGHIAAVEMLTPAPDEKLVQQARGHFARRRQEEPFDGFEVWDHARRVYTWPEESDELKSS